MRLIIAGGREFNDYPLLKSTLDNFLQNITDPITIISGTARGADKLGERYAQEKGYECIKFPAMWEKYGKASGYRRNVEMAEVATHCVVFWDYMSRGSKSMIDIAKRKGIILKVVKYK